MVNEKESADVLIEKSNAFSLSSEAEEIGKWLSIRGYVDIFTQNSC